MAFSAILTLTMLLSKIIFRFIQNPAQLAILRAPMIITSTPRWSDGAPLDRTLGALRASATGGGRPALAHLADRLGELRAVILQELAGDDAAGSNRSLGAVPAPSGPHHLV